MEDVALDGVVIYRFLKQCIICREHLRWFVASGVQLYAVVYQTFALTWPSSRNSAPKNQSSSGAIRATVERRSSLSFDPRARNLAAKDQYHQDGFRGVRSVHPDDSYSW